MLRTVHPVVIRRLHWVSVSLVVQKDWAAARRRAGSAEREASEAHSVISARESQEAVVTRQAYVEPQPS